MGLFSFFKKAGSKALVEEEKKSSSMAAEIIKTQKESVLKSLVKSIGVEVADLHIELNDDAVTVSGVAPSQADKEKVVLAIGNVEGIATVDDRMAVAVQEAAEPEAESQFYEVQKGDSLSKIAKEFYGDAMKYPVIFEANQPMLSDPDKIYPGQLLRIPPIA